MQILSCENYGTITSINSKKGGVGGILGGSFNGYTVIESSKNEGNITASVAYAGGIAGIAYSDVKNCANYGNIENTKGDASGICVSTSLEVSYSFNKGNISAKENAGGISVDAKTEVCYNTGEVKGYNSGGISVPSWSSDGLNNTKSLTSQYRMRGQRGTCATIIFFFGLILLFSANLILDQSSQCVYFHFSWNSLDLSVSSSHITNLKIHENGLSLANPIPFFCDVCD